MKHFFFAIGLLCLACFAQAAGSNFSYLYIQGDKQTPFYVKLEDAMQPRYGKNYCIIPRLAPGPTNIEILFQQNAFPAHKFTVLIPEGGSRGFMLVRSDAGFMLYDLQQGFYLPVGNKADQDHLPAVTPAVRPAAADPEVAPVAAAQATPEPIAQEKPQPTAKKAAGKTESAAAPKEEPASNAPVFIRDIEFSKGTARDTGAAASGRSRVAAGVVNTDCPTPLSSEAFGKVFAGVSRLTTDEDRIEYLGGQMHHCYETWQARTLAGRLESDVARYDLLRKIYPRITDQAAFPLLDDLLTTDIWKAEFNRLVHR